MRNVQILGEIKTHILCLINVILENRALYEIMWKKSYIARQATGDSIAQAHCMLDT